MYPVCLLVGFIFPLFASFAFAVPTDKQVERVVQQLQDKDSKTRQATLEIVRGTEYMSDLRVQQAVVDRFADTSTGVRELAILMAKELPEVPTRLLSYIFEKSVVATGDGGWTSWGQDAGVAFFKDRKGNNAALFHQLMEDLLRLLDRPYPSFPASNWTRIADAFHGLGVEVSFIADFPLMRKILAKVPADVAYKVVYKFTESFEPFSQAEQNEMVRLFLTSEELKGTSDAVFSRSALELSKALSLPTLEQLRNIILRGSPFQQVHARNMFDRSLKNGDKGQALLVEDILQNAKGNRELTRWAFVQIYYHEFVSLVSNPRSVIDRAIEVALSDSDNEYPLRMLLKNINLLQSEDFGRLFALMRDDRFVSRFLEETKELKIDLANWETLFGYLRHSDGKARANAIRIIDAKLDFAKLGLDDEATAIKISNNLNSCSQSEFEPVKAFCTKKFVAYNAFFKENITSFSLRYLFSMFKEDIRTAIKDPFLNSHYQSYRVYLLFNRLTADARLRWTAEEFRAIWLPFFVEQFRLGDKATLYNTWTFLAFFRFEVAPGQPFWQLSPNDKVVEALRARFLSGDSPASRQAGQILSTLGYIEKNQIGADIRQSLNALLDDSRPYVVTTALKGIAMEFATPELIKRVLALTKSEDPEVRGSALGVIGYAFAAEKVGREVYVPLLPEVQKALRSPSLQERVAVSGVNWIPKQFPDVHDALFSPAFVSQMLEDFVATRERFLRDDSEAATYFETFNRIFLSTSPKYKKEVPFDQFPTDLMIETLTSPNLNIAMQATRSYYRQQSSFCEQAPKKRCGTFQSGDKTIKVVLPKKSLDQYAELAKKSPQSEQVFQMNQLLNEEMQLGEKWIFSILEYAAGKQVVVWDP